MLTALLLVAFAQPPPDLQGTWRLEYTVVTKNELPVVGSLKSKSRSVVLAKVVDTDGVLVQTHSLCASDLNGGLVKSTLPDAYIRHIPPKVYPLKIESKGDEFVFSADTGALTVGFDPGCDHVPETADDPCVFDWDEDGQPGATVQAKAPLFPWVDVYTAQRNHLVLAGRVRSADHIDGLARMTQMTNHVIGASNKLFARSPTSTIVDDESVFTMTRLPAGATCADALQAN